MIKRLHFRVIPFIHSHNHVFSYNSYSNLKLGWIGENVSSSALGSNISGLAQTKQNLPLSGSLIVGLKPPFYTDYYLASMTVYEKKNNSNNITNSNNDNHYNDNNNNNDYKKWEYI